MRVVTRIGWVLVLVLLALGAVWLTRSKSVQSPDPATVHELTSDEARVAPEALPESRGIVRTASRASSTRGVPMLRVAVVEDGGDRPCAGAEVVLVSAVPQLTDPFAIDVVPPGEAARVRGSGVRTDRAGMAELVRPEGALWVCARSGERYGQVVLQPWEVGIVRIGLQPDRTLRVRAVGADGSPAVGIEIRERLVPAGGGSERTDILGKTAGPDGLLVVPHYQCVDALLSREVASASRATLSAVVLGTKHEEVDYDHTNPPSTPIVVPVAPCGSVLVRIVDSNGAPVILRSGSVNLSLREPGVAGTTVPPASASRFATENVSECLFTHVALGKDVGVTVQGVYAANDPVRSSGPRRDGECVEIVMRPSTTGPVLRGTALRPEGRTWEGAWMALRIEGGSYMGSGFVPVAKDGRFEIPLGSRALGASPSALIWSVYDANGATGERLRTAPATTLSEGTIGVGVLRFTVPPVLVSGVLVEAEGTPLRAPRPYFGVSARARGATRYERISDEVAPHHEAGRFVIHGSCAATDLALTVASEGYVPIDPVPFTPGAKDLRIVLQRAGTVSGRLLHDGSASLVHADLVQEAVAVASKHRLGLIFTRDVGVASFLSKRVPPGSWKLVLTMLDDPSPLLTIEHLEVRGGEICEDPRLAAIDLRDVCRRIDLDFVDDAGAPLRNTGGAVFVDTPDQELRTGNAVVHGRCSLFARRPTLDVLVSVPGFEPLALTGVHSSRTVRLTRLKTVQLEFAAQNTSLGGCELRWALHKEEVAPPSAPWRIYSPEWSTSEGTGPLPHSTLTAVATDAAPTCEIPHLGAGNYRIEANLVTKGPVVFRKAELVKFAPKTLRIPDAGDPSPISITIDPDELASKRATLER